MTHKIKFCFCGADKFTIYTRFISCRYCDRLPRTVSILYMKYFSGADRVEYLLSETWSTPEDDLKYIYQIAHSFYSYEYRGSQPSRCCMVIHQFFYTCMLCFTLTLQGNKSIFCFLKIILWSYSYLHFKIYL